MIQGSSLNLELSELAKLASQQDQKPPVSIFPALGLQVHAPAPSFPTRGSKKPDSGPHIHITSTSPTVPFPQPLEQHFVGCDICHAPCSTNHVRFSHDILFSRKCPRRDSKRKRITGDMAVPHHPAWKHGRLLSHHVPVPKCYNAHIFPSSPSAGEQMAESHCSWPGRGRWGLWSHPSLLSIWFSSLCHQLLHKSSSCSSKGVWT